MVTYLGSLVQLCCGEGGTLQTNITGMCGECSQCLGYTGFAPACGVCAFTVYTAQAPGCSAGELSKVGPGLHAHPRSKPLRFRFSGTPQRPYSGGPVFCTLSSTKQLRHQVLSERTLPRRGGASHHLPRPSCLVSWVCSGSTVSGVLCVSSGVLISSCNPPGGCQLSRVPGRLG